MATTVSCQVSTLCNTTVTALENNANVTAAENTIGKGGCTGIPLDDTACPYTQATGLFSCGACVTTYANRSTFESVVTAAGGVACFVDLSIVFNGTQTVTNTTSRPVALITGQTAQSPLAVGANCTTTDIATLFTGILADSATAYENADNLKPGYNITWNSVTLKITGCGAERSLSKTFGGATTTAPPTTPSGTTTTPPTVPPSSTGKSGASIIASSVALVASLCAAVTILA